MKMDHTIARRLNGLLRRFRLFRMLWSLTIVWIVVAIVGYMLLGYGRQVNGLPNQYVQGWIAAFAIGTLGCWWYARLKHRDLRSIAELIESRFPSLEQRLTTAVELRPTEENGRFTYLQRSVISEALVHDVRNEWDSLVSMRRIVIAALAGLPSLIAICAVGFALLRLPKTTIEPIASTNPNEVISSKVLPPEVVPGNTEVQKGDSIIVTARFPGQLPGKVWLVRQPLSDSEKADDTDSVDRQLMKQSLSDPLFAAYLNDIRQPVEYRIEYDAEKTQNFSVKVFECPEVVRADAKLSYPLYTKLDPKEIADTRRVAAPIGTTLTWLVHLSKPIASGKLVPKSSSDPIELVIDKENPLLASCSLVVTQNAQWNVQLVDSDDRQNKIDFSLRVSALANKEPTLKLTSGGDAVVSALQEFEIVAKVKDDYALTSVGIGYQLADGELIEHELEVVSSADAKKSKDSTVSTMIDFEALKAQPDLLLSYYLWAEDLDENGEPRRIVTDMYFAEVRPFDEVFRQSDQNAEQEQQQQQQNQNGQQQGGQGEELLELQKQIISASWNINRLATSKGLPTRSKEDLETVAQSQAQAIEMLAEVAAQAEGDQEAEVAIAQASMSRAVEQLEKATESLKKSDLSKAIGFEQHAYQSLLKLQPKERQVGRSQRSQRSQQQSSRQQQRQQQLNQMELDQEENRYQDERKAQEEQDSTQQSETRQIASRLRELAMRQQDLNQQLRDVEAALQAAETKEQREELEQRLERLRQQQQQILEDTDELQDKLQESQNPNMQETQEQLQQTRENLQQANQSLRENNTGQALASGSRAQEQLEEMREEVRQQAANQFGETMQQMRGQAGELQQRQEELVKELQDKKSEAPSTTGLRDAQQKDPEQTKELVRQQREQLEKLTDRMQETIEQAEESEPLLAQKLFDGYRRTQQEGVDEQLKNTENLMNRRLESQAQNQAEATLEDLKSLNNDISQAADSVLGSDVNSMRMALDQLEVARQQIENEIARETGRQPGEASGARSQQDGQRNQQQAGQEANGQSPEGSRNGEQTEQQRQPGDGAQSAENPQGQKSQQNPTQRGQGQPGQNQEGQEPGQESSQQAGQQGQRGQQQSGEQQGQQAGQQPGQQQQPGQAGQQQSQQPGQQGQQPGQQAGQASGRQGQRPGQQQSGGNQQPGLRNGSIDPADTADDATRPGLLGGNGLNPRDLQASPIAGEDFRQWSDRLRDVEELISDPELRWQATRIRQAARNLRTDVQRGSKAPQWSDVEDLVATPLRELQRKVSQELLRRAAEQTEIVPVDRDPVPNQYRDMVREYYERLGKGR